MGDSSLAEVPARIVGHVSAAVLGAAFVFFFLIDVQLFLAATLGPRAVSVATWPLQSAALLAMVGALSFTEPLADALLGFDPAGNGWLMWNPAAWFVGIYRWVSGDTRAVFALLAMRAAVASTLAMTVALVAYPTAYERCLHKAVASEGHRAWRRLHAGTRLWLRSLAPWLRTPLERGLASFIMATLTRSHAHRFLIGSYTGIGVLCAVPLAGRLLGPAHTIAAQYAWFSIPLGLLCWTTAALRVAMMLPVEPASNWVFQTTEPVDKRRVLSTAVTVIQGATVVPLAMIFGAASGIAGGLAPGVAVFAVVLSTGLALVELLTLRLRTVPCTCTYRPGQLRLRALWPVYLTVWIAIAYRLPTLAVSALGDVISSLSLVAALLAAWAVLRMWRLVRARQLRGFVYEETEPSVTTIDLSSARI